MLQLLSNLAARFISPAICPAMPPQNVKSVEAIWILPTSDVASVGRVEVTARNEEKRRGGGKEREEKRKEERERKEKRTEKKAENATRGTVG